MTTPGLLFAEVIQSLAALLGLRNDQKRCWMDREVRAVGPSSSVPAPPLHIPLQKMGPNDDPEAFEKSAEECGWPQLDWPVRLIPLLSGEAQIAAQQLPVQNLRHQMVACLGVGGNLPSLSLSLSSPFAVSKPVPAPRSRPGCPPQPMPRWKSGPPAGLPAEQRASARPMGPQGGFQTVGPPLSLSPRQPLDPLPATRAEMEVGTLVRVPDCPQAALDQAGLYQIPHAECSPYNRTSDTPLNKMDDWTKEDVYQWIMKLKVDQKYADKLYSEDVSGASLILFDKQDFLDVGLTHGPAVQIVKNVALFKTSSENFEHSAIPKDTDASVRLSAIQHFQEEKAAAESPTTGSAELETSAPFSIEENMGGKSSVQRWSEDIPKYTSSGWESFLGASPLQDKKDLLLEERDDGMCTKGDGANGAQSLDLPLTHCTNQTNDVGNETNELCKSSVFYWCKPRTFDESSTTFEYVQNDILPPETGPSNLIDPLHEYKLMANTENALEKNVFKKFRDEACRFAAGCMNVRTNGTIHFGVGDEPLYKHGQIIGIEVPSQREYIDEFDKGLNEHFKENNNIARACIRPPKFVKVKCTDKKDKWVIEIDVVPKYKLTEKKLFYTTLDKKRRKSKCLFIRSGANTINYFPDNNPKICKQNKKKLMCNLELWILSRQLAEDHGSVPNGTLHHGDCEVHETV